MHLSDLKPAVTTSQSKKCVFAYHSSLILVNKPETFYCINNLNKFPNYILFSVTNKKLNNVNLNLNFIKKKIEKFYYQNSNNSDLDFRLKFNWIFFKFKYQGKGLKIKKSNNDSQFIFNLGSSHISKLFFKKTKVYVNRTKKNTYTFYTVFKKNKLHSNMSARIRLYNKYTKRGLRFNRQAIVRRFGKVSQLLPKKK